MSDAIRALRRLPCRLRLCPLKPVAYFKDRYDSGTTYSCKCGERRTDVLGDQTGWELGLYEREKTDE